MPFNQIIGQTRVIQSLRSSLRREAIAHAYLFFGPEGVGKKLTAFGLAKAINCLQQNGDFCGQCDSCRRIEKGIHPDLFFIEPEGLSLKVDQLRDLQSAIRYRPFLAKRKVCIIDQAEKMTPSAANSVLKTLEEPPGDTVLILVTSDSNQILPTIRSRCRVLLFSPLPQADLQGLITEKMNLPSDKAHLLATFAGGSFGRALNLDLAGLEEKRREILQLITTSYSGGRESLFDQARNLAERGKSEDLCELLDLWLCWYYDLWKYQISGDERTLINIDQGETIRRQAGMLAGHQIEKNIQLIQQTYKAMQRNANKRLAMEVMMMNLTSITGQDNEYER